MRDQQHLAFGFDKDLKIKICRSPARSERFVPSLRLVSCRHKALRLPAQQGEE